MHLLQLAEIEAEIEAGFVDVESELDEHAHEGAQSAPDAAEPVAGPELELACTSEARGTTVSRSEVATVDLECDSTYHVSKHSWTGRKVRQLSIGEGVLETRTRAGAMTNRWLLSDVIESRCLPSADKAALFTAKVRLRPPFDKAARRMHTTRLTPSPDCRRARRPERPLARTQVATKWCWAPTSTLTFSAPSAHERDQIVHKLRGH